MVFFVAEMSEAGPEAEVAAAELEPYGDARVRALCRDYAAYTRVSLAEEHGQIVTQIAALEEQLHTFSQLLEVVGSDTGSLLGPGGLPEAREQWRRLEPGLARVDRLEELVARVRTDLDTLELQLEQAEATVGGGPLKQVSTVLKNPLSLFGRVPAPPSPGPSRFHPAELLSTEDYFPRADSGAKEPAGAGEQAL
jgi:hypothetical protein